MLRVNNTIESVHLPTVFLRDDPDLDDIRKALVHGPLGTPENDIFFPTWTKSIHVLQGTSADQQVMTVSDIDHAKITISSSEQLCTMLNDEERTPGNTTIVLQECRSKRYSRKAVEPTPVPHSHHQPRHSHSNSHNSNHSISSHYAHVQASSPSIHPMANSFPDRTYHVIDPSFTLTTSTPTNQSTAPTYLSTQPHASMPHSISPHPNFDGTEHAIVFYPDPFLSYGVIPPPPGMFPPIYAVPWNVGCFNYVPAAPPSPTWFMA